LSITRISPCPYETFIEAYNLDPRENMDPVALMRMEDGHWQEKQIIEHLARTGWEMTHTGEDQMTVHVGRTEIPGRPDGFIKVGGAWDQLEVKAVNEDRYHRMVRKGIEGRIRCQTQLCMSSREERDMGIERTWVYSKHKDSCTPHDFDEIYDPEYAKPVMEAADRIMEGWKPEKKEHDLCASCNHKVYCWQPDIILDMDGITAVEGMKKYVDMWKEGKDRERRGKELVKEARGVLEGVVGEDDVALVEDLKLQRVIRHTPSIPLDRYLEIHGKDHFKDVLQEKRSEYIDIREV
jgi:CRISPR/Cas system-associated exonuclease Cas4 (RecB family)